MKTGVIASLLVVAIIAGAGYFTGASIRTTLKATNTSVETTTAAKTEVVTSYTSAWCTRHLRRNPVCAHPRSNSACTSRETQGLAPQDLIHP